MNHVQFRLEIFSGPLDLLLSLIEKNKVDIYDIPIAVIFEQYMEYLDEMRALDMEIAGEFIVCAAELMRIKSRSLLPKSSEAKEDDPRIALAEALAEYKRAKSAAVKLAELYELHSGRIAKDTDSLPPLKDAPQGLNPDLLHLAFDKILQRRGELPKLISESERTLESLLSGRTVTVGERILHIMRRMRREPEIEFGTLMLSCRSRSELIATFMAILELLRSQRLCIVNNRSNNTDNTDNTEQAPDDILLRMDLSHHGRNRGEQNRNQ